MGTVISLRHGQPCPVEDTLRDCRDAHLAVCARCSSLVQDGVSIIGIAFLQAEVRKLDDAISRFLAVSRSPPVCACFEDMRTQAWALFFMARAWQDVGSQIASAAFSSAYEQYSRGRQFHVI